MHFEIAYKWIFFLLPLPFIVYWVLPALRKRRAALITPAFKRAIEISGQKPKKNAWITRRNLLTWIVLFLCWTCLLGAASSPRYVGKPTKKTKTVRSFLIAADISFSMAETDWVLDGKRTSRWGAVKYLMKDFVVERKSDQIGLVMLGTHAYLQAPLTTDLNSITWLLDQTEVGMAGQMTSIGEAIAYGIKVFKEDTVKQKIMLLMTDGIDDGKQINPLDAAQAAKKDSITIFTIGIGKSKSEGGYALDEKTLRDIANITGGKYFNAMDEGQMKLVYAELNKLQPVEYEEEAYKPVTLLYMYPLAAAAALALFFHLANGLVNLFRRRG
ncbi:VWA domain-containing protein [Chitinophagaceae bacterium LWZ2-11]